MTNLCENRLAVFGSKETIGTFIEKVRTNDEHLSRAIDLTDHKDNSDNSNEVEDKIRYAYEATLFREGVTCVVYEFDTRCRPAFEWFSDLTDAHENASFMLEYEERLAYGSGRIIVIEGEFDEKNSFEVDHFRTSVFELCRRYE